MSGFVIPHTHRSRGLSAIDGATGRLIPGFDGPITRTTVLAADAKRLYLDTGPDGRVPGVLRRSTGAWDDSPSIASDGRACDVQPAPAGLFVGGGFRHFGGRLQPNFGAVTIS
jgi:hypothetical protein